MWDGAWPSQQLNNQTSSLETLIRTVDSPPRLVNEEAAGIAAQLLVIRSCGYLEQISEQSVVAYLQSKSAPRASAFGASWLGRGSNPSPGKLVALVQRLDKSWAAELLDLFNLDDEVLKRDIEFLVSSRNRIAHGQSNSIGTRRALDLSKSVLIVTQWFIERFDPR